MVGTVFPCNYRTFLSTTDAHDVGGILLLYEVGVILLRSPSALQRVAVVGHIEMHLLGELLNHCH